MEQLSDKNKELLLQLAQQTIRMGLDSGKKPTIKLGNYEKNVQSLKACFVTLYLNQSLRGCIGSLEAQMPLVHAVIDAAHSAAFLDPRFPPLQRSEFDSLDTSISVLSEPVPMQFNAESELLSQLQPGVDGLILEDKSQRSTFLPSVWEQLPRPTDFLNQLKRKAGFPPNYWSNSIRISRYHADVFHDK